VRFIPNTKYLPFAEKPFWTLLLKGEHEVLNADDAYRDPENARWAFGEHYRMYVYPHVRNFEDKRCTALKKYRERMMIAVPIYVLYLLGLGFWLLDNSNIDNDVFTLSIALYALLLWWGSIPLRKYKSDVKKQIFPNIFSFFGEGYSYSEDCRFAMSKYDRSDLLPRYNREHKEDYIKGLYKSVGFELFETTLKLVTGSGKNRRTRTVFKGVFIKLTMNKGFKGRTIVKRDRGSVGNWFANKFSAKKDVEHVGLEDPIFENKFEVTSTDQVEARYLLTTSFMERLNHLNNLFGGSQLECSFYDKKVLFKIWSDKNRFEVHDIYKPATFEEDIHHIFEEMQTIFDMIEHLKLHEQTRL